VVTPGVSRPLADIQTEAVFQVDGTPDWSVATKDSVWVSSARANHVVQLIPTTNKAGLIVDMQRPCSGLADGFGSIWVPSCAAHSLARIDPTTGKTIADIAADPANSEGGITVGAGSVWIVTKPSALVRIDPKTNTVSATIQLPSGSDNPAFGDSFVWVSSFEHDQLLKVDPSSNTIVATIPVGPKPRFLTVGAGSVWTLNQGDGTISRVDIKTGKVLATIPCGIPGGGGEITFGSGSVWATVFDFPLTQIDPKTNKVVKQWAGQGGDGIRFGFGSVWLSNLRQGNVWRLSPDQK
jgi:streptogramin lyase